MVKDMRSVIKGVVKDHRIVKSQYLIFFSLTTITSTILSQSIQECSFQI